MVPTAPVLLALAVVAPSPPCGPAPSSVVRELRGHLYRQIGSCQGIPVFRTDRTDSSFRDREAAGEPLVLVAAESVDPTAETGGWPAPVGNLYLSAPLAMGPAAARARLSSVLAAWWVAALPEVELTEGWEGDYGAHRGPDGRLLSGLVVTRLPTGAAIGLDLHLNATESAYVALGHPGAHATLAALTGQPVNLDETLWALLPRLLDGGLSP